MGWGKEWDSQGPLGRAGGLHRGQGCRAGSFTSTGLAGPHLHPGPGGSWGHRGTARHGTAQHSAAPGSVLTLFAPIWAARAAPGWARRMQDRPGLRIAPGWEQEREREEGWGFLCDGSSSSLRPLPCGTASPCAGSGTGGSLGGAVGGGGSWTRGPPAPLGRSPCAQHPLRTAGHRAAGPAVGPELPVGRTSRRDDAGGGGGWERRCGLRPRVPPPPGAPSCWA